MRVCLVINWLYKHLIRCFYFLGSVGQLLQEVRGIMRIFLRLISTLTPIHFPARRHISFLSILRASHFSHSTISHHSTFQHIFLFIKISHWILETHSQTKKQITKIFEGHGIPKVKGSPFVSCFSSSRRKPNHLAAWPPLPIPHWAPIGTILIDSYK